MQDLSKLILEAAKKSKVITNPDGTPKEYYHGSHEDFVDFKHGNMGDHRAHYFTTDKESAEHYAQGRAYYHSKPHGFVHTVHLSATKTLETDETNNYRDDVRWARSTKSHDSITGPTHDGPNNSHHNRAVLEADQIHHVKSEKVHIADPEKMARLYPNRPVKD